MKRIWGEAQQVMSLSGQLYRELALSAFSLIHPRKSRATTR